MNQKHVNMGDAINFGWEKFKTNVGILIGSIAIVLLISYLPMLIFFPNMMSNFKSGQTDMPSAYIILSIITGLVSVVLYMGLIKISLELYDNKPVNFRMLLSQGSLFITYLIASIIVGFCVGIGMVLLIVPGIIIALMWLFYSFLIVDRHAGIMESLKFSANLTKGVKFDLFIFLLVLVVLNCIGCLVLLVGLLVTAPISCLAMAFVYRQLLEAEDGTIAPSVNPPTPIIS
jgi:uncharacterized membrane protein